ncbi:MAG: PA14 domain-containing protein, partial [Mycobacteriales bacterium]
PVLSGGLDDPVTVPASHLSGVVGEYFANQTLADVPAVVRREKAIDFDWGSGSPDPKIPNDHFSARWSGSLVSIEKSGDYLLGAMSDDGSRLWLDGKLIVDAWRPRDHAVNTAKVHLEAGHQYAIRLEYFEAEGEASCKLVWQYQGATVKVPSVTVWIPPGGWQNLWSGERVQGPKLLIVKAPLGEMPMFAKDGGIVVGSKLVQNTQHLNWGKLVLDVFSSHGSSAPSKHMIYEDDGISPAYLKGNGGLTEVTWQGDSALTIGPRRGAYAGMPSQRSVLVRVHLARRRTPVALLNGRRLKVTMLKPSPTHTMPFSWESGGSAPQDSGGIALIEVPPSDPKRELHLRIR